jgi:Family of unknown function (DUF5522)
MVVDPDSVDVSTLSPGKYFRAGSFLVLTPSYYRNRGECCNSGCRHCPFRELANADEKSE